SIAPQEYVHSPAKAWQGACKHCEESGFTRPSLLRAPALDVSRAHPPLRGPGRGGGGRRLRTGRSAPVQVTRRDLGKKEKILAFPCIPRSTNRIRPVPQGGAVGNKEENAVVDAPGVVDKDAQEYAQVLGIREGMTVQEVGWDEDCDSSISEAVEDIIGEEL